MPNPALPLLLPPGAFTCPRCLVAAQLISTGSRTNPLAGRCNRCEHSYQFTLTAPSTTTTGAGNTQGATVLTVAAGASFTLGMWLVVDAASVAGGAEVVRASGAGGATTIPVAATPLRLAHAAGATVQAATLGPLGGMT